MSKILVIQPHKMLQHAIALSLFPQHQAQMASSIPESGEVKDVDAVIVDAASLTETHRLSAQAIRLLQDWNLPIIWIDSVDSSAMPIDENFVAVRTPILKKSLQSAVAQCLGELPKRAGKRTRTTDQGQRSSRNVAASAEPVKGEVIELVDVVEETPKIQDTSAS
ncbi:MAG: hypothetical protein ACM3TN_28415 [Alphaproteobacteria bacterium]